MDKSVEVLQLKGFQGNKMKIAQLDFPGLPFIPVFSAVHFDFEPGAIMGFGVFWNTSQVIMCISGSCMVKTLKGGQSEVFNLTSPLNALYIEQGIWFELFNFSDNASVQILYSRNPSEADFSSDFNEYLNKNNFTS